MPLMSSNCNEFVYIKHYLLEITWMTALSNKIIGRVIHLIRAKNASDWVIFSNNRVSFAINRTIIFPQLQFKNNHIELVYVKLKVVHTPKCTKMSWRKGNTKLVEYTKSWILSFASDSS